MSTLTNDDGAMLQLPATLAAGCAESYGWTEEFTARAITGYRQFMKLKLNLEDWDATQLAPSAAVEEVWQQHILYTTHYAKACKDYTGGHTMEHHPEVGLDNNNEAESTNKTERIKTTQLGMKSLFGRNKMDAEIWALDSVGDGEQQNIYKSKKRRRLEA
ncbi:expressed unknown protein [Seminavis robusta]|uniref:Uncharacterized protein n=1 Tax=Seminavis robusta TaxID=568900 RepID=A0A9N8DAJ1_9STRA|nr:expressed unknown protein [Seminavis robusta]|eukprot:Sro16_g011850.1 n/a (160) ;mRNA; r:138857-139336